MQGLAVQQIKFVSRVLILIALVGPAAADNCRLQSASQMVSKRAVGQIDDLVKIKSPGRCNVKFSVSVDGKVHTVNWTHEDVYDPEVACQIAIENGMNELFLRLPGQFQTQSITVCKEGSNVKDGFRPVEIGERILENQVSQDPKEPGYFKFNRWPVCKKFMEQYNYHGLRVNKGIICRVDGNLWQVVEKW
jgi:hypothetical protein